MGAVTSDRIARYLALIEPERAPQTLEELWQRLAEGESLASVCKAWDVPYGRLMAWLMVSPDRYSVYQRALEVAAHELVSQALSIADDGKPEIVEHTNKDGTITHVPVFPDVQRAKLRIDTRFRLAKHHAPATYGEAQASAGSGIQVIVNRFGGQARDETASVSADGKTLTVH